MIPGDYVIVSQVMRHGFTIGKLVTNQSAQAGLLKVSHKPLLLVKVDLNQRLYCLYSLNQMLLFLFMLLIKTRLLNHNSYIENCLKLIVKEIRKHRKSSGTKDIKLLRNNARPHTHFDVINYLTKEGIIIIPHPSHSLDLVTCNY